MGDVRDFMRQNYRHFNARETVRAADAFEAHVDAGGKMLVSLAGAMSTAELGLTLARMIRAGKVHALSCTGANLEEDVFNLLGNRRYQMIDDWRALSRRDEKDLYERGLNRVTDTCVPEDVMLRLVGALRQRWSKACQDGSRRMPGEFMMDVLRSGVLDEHFEVDRSESWLIAAMEAGIPVYAPGWEDSTMGNMFAAAVMTGAVAHHQCVKTGTEQFQHLIEWYRENHGVDAGVPSVGFFQIGGGIAGDFAICTVPAIIQDLEIDVPFWGYFCQITDAEVSYGGYSGAVPNEKITWGKLDVDTPSFLIKSDATIVAPLIFAWVLGD